MHSGRTGTPSSWVSSCQFINLRSGSVSAQVTAGKAGGGGRWFCAHANFLQSLSSKLPHPGRWLETKEPSLSSPSQADLTPGGATQNPHGGWAFLQQKGGSGGGESQTPCPRLRGKVDRSLHPSLRLRQSPWRSHVRPCGGGEACVNSWENALTCG